MPKGIDRFQIMESKRLDHLNRFSRKRKEVPRIFGVSENFIESTPQIQD
jgi:hypothetical protein